MEPAVEPGVLKLCEGYRPRLLLDLSAADIAALRAAVEAKPDTQITIDLEKMTVRTCCDLELPVNMPESAREALVSGRWDPIQELIDSKLIAP